MLLGVIVYSQCIEWHHHAEWLDKWKRRGGEAEPSAKGTSDFLGDAGAFARENCKICVAEMTRNEWKFY